jgi:hypothetical protein
MSETIPVPLWFVLLVLLCLVGISWGLRGAISALRDLFTVYRDLRGGSDAE